MLETNTLNSVIASIFSQKQPDGEWHPIIYYLKTIIDVKLNYHIYNKEMLAIISSFQHQHIQLEGTPKPIKVVSDYKALEYFIITKALMAQQARQADILSQFNFLIIYRPGAINCMDTLIRRKQDLGNQAAAKILLQTQILLQLEYLNPQIQAELNTDPLDAEIYPINSMELNLINKLLQTNRTAPSLQEYRKEVKDATSLQSLKNGLLKHQKRLVVAKEQNLWTQLIAEAHTQVSTAHPRKNKTYKIIGNCYYQPGIVMDINCYIQNYNDCYRSIIL